MTTRTRKTTRKAADAIVMDSKYDAILSGDYEKTEAGHVYGLEDGSAVVVTFSGELVHFPAEDEMPLEDEGFFAWIWDGSCCVEDEPSSDELPFRHTDSWDA